MNWLACRVITGKEYEIRAKLEKIVPSIKIEVPRRYYIDIVNKKVKHRSERMLPGYILIGTEKPLNTTLIDKFIQVIGVVTEEEYMRLKAQEGQKEEVLEHGSKVLILEGPFQGCKGKIDRHNDDGTLLCKIQFAGIELDATMKPNLVSCIS